MPKILVIDNDLIGMVRRTLSGIEVTDETLALDVIKKVGPNGSYIMEAHTLEHFRKELYISDIVDQEKRETWQQKGEKGMLEKARDKARKILAEHRPIDRDPNLMQELDDYVKSVAVRSLDDFYAAEWEG